MNRINFHNDGFPITDSRLLSFEKMIGNKLPDDFRNYLLKYNGATPYVVGNKENDVFVQVQWDGKEPEQFGSEAVLDSCGVLLPNPQDWSSNRQFDDLRYLFETFQEYIPDDTIPIGNDPGGHLFLLGIKGKNHGKIFYWSRHFRQRDENDKPTYDNVAFIANSFTEFLQKLEPELDD